MISSQTSTPISRGASSSVGGLNTYRSGSAVIGDWLYDERIEPHLNPTTLRDAAIRLITQEEHGAPA